MTSYFSKEIEKDAIRTEIVLRLEGIIACLNDPELDPEASHYDCKEDLRYALDNI